MDILYERVLLGTGSYLLGVMATAIGLYLGWIKPLQNRLRLHGIRIEIDN